MDDQPTRPNAARIYDYLLGGTHNRPVDRAAAEQMMQMMQHVPETARLYRSFLHSAVRELVQSNFTCYLDLASGIPTEGYIHELVPPSTNIIYNDIDPDTVRYAREIVGDRPNIRCLQGDLRQIDAILAEAESFFGAERRIGICLVNVSYFIDDEPLREVFQQLYNWCAPGSMLAVSAFDQANRLEEGFQQLMTFYRSIGVPLYSRSREELLQLASPWQESTPLQPVEQFVDERVQRALLVDLEQRRGELGYAGILIRP